MKHSLAAALLAALFAFGVAAAAEAGSKDVLTKAHALIHKHDDKGAIALLDALLQKDPKNAEALVTRGDAKDNLGQHLEALVDYSAAIEINPDYAYAYYTKCETEVSIARDEQAIADCTKAITLDASNAEAFVERAFAYENVGRYDEGLKDADTAIKMDASSAEAFNARCRAERSLKEYAAARTDCKKSIALDPEYERPVWNLAMTEFRTGHFGAAASGFEKALKLDDSDEYSHYWSALSYYELQQYPKALTHINVYISKQQTDGDGYFNRAKIEAATGDKAAARTDFNESIRLYKVANDQDGIDSATKLLADLDKP